MLTLFIAGLEGISRSVVSAPLEKLPRNTLWLDLLCPSAEEEQLVERLLSFEVPTRADMQEIEASSRLYSEKNALIMTMPVLTKSSTVSPESSPVTFVLTNGCLVTVRYDDPAPFSCYIQNIHREPPSQVTPEHILLGLLEQIADRLADILERATCDLEKLSRDIFGSNDVPRGSVDFKNILRNVGYVGDLSTKAKDSLLNLNRLLPFLAAQTKGKRDIERRIGTLIADAVSINQHATFLSAKAGFLLDATLGMVNIEQNNIIKIFSIAAVVFLPPTLIASIYGMNFHFMPELEWMGGYPLAVMLMLISAILPVWLFHRKKWL
ncbi:MAG: magnesium transporter CorA family protein [Bdellovibrionales bacterium]|jgi:magnesium transporter